MTVVVLLVLAVLFVVWRVRKRARAARLAGLSSTAPVFSVDPPRRRLGRLKDEVL